MRSMGHILENSRNNVNSQLGDRRGRALFIEGESTDTLVTNQAPAEQWQPRHDPPVFGQQSWGYYTGDEEWANAYDSGTDY